MKSASTMAADAERGCENTKRLAAAFTAVSNCHDEVSAAEAQLVELLLGIWRKEPPAAGPGAHTPKNDLLTTDRRRAD